MQKVIEIKNLSFSYTHKNLILENINLSINKGDFVALIGDNGAGKTTLFKLIVSSLKPSSGEIILFEKQKKDYSYVSYIPQLGTDNFSNFITTVKEFVSSNIRTKSIFDYIKSIYKREKITLEMLKELGIYDLRNKSITELSGGQKQKVLIARALVANPKFILLDEPTTGVDQKSIQTFFELMSNLNKNKDISILMITHNLKESIKYINKVYKLHDKKIEKINILDLN